MGYRYNITKTETKPFVEINLWTGMTMIRVGVYTAADKKSSMVPKIFEIFRKRKNKSLKAEK